MNGEVISISALVGFALFFLGEYVPRFSEWFDGLEPVGKRLVMFGLVLVSAAAWAGLSCGGVLPELYALVCSQAGLFDLLGEVVAYLLLIGTANQVSHAYLKKG